jgi:hypothetical protein
MKKNIQTIKDHIRLSRQQKGGFMYQKQRKKYEIDKAINAAAIESLNAYAAVNEAKNAVVNAAVINAVHAAFMVASATGAERIYLAEHAANNAANAATNREKEIRWQRKKLLENYLK